MFSKSICRLTGILVLCLAVGTTASAQYGGGTGGSTGTGSGTPGSTSGYGSSPGKAIGIGVGVAAAAAVGIALLVHHHHKASSTDASLVGCTQPLLNGISIRNEKDSETYLILSGGTSLQPGERVELNGVVVDDRSGSRAFRVRSVVNNFGTCGTTAEAKETASTETRELPQVAK